MPHMIGDYKLDRIDRNRQELTGIDKNRQELTGIERIDRNRQE